LIVTPDKTGHLILSGVRRFECVKELGYSELPCVVTVVKDQTLAIIEHNKYRQKTPTQIYNEAQVLRKILEPKARRRQGKRTDLSSNLMESREAIDVQKKVAESLNVSVGYLSMLEQVMENKHGIPEVVKRLEEGRETVYSAYKLLKGSRQAKQKSHEFSLVTISLGSKGWSKT
jgi:ParB-like chromosome segregation protein Spo0J